MQLERIVLFVVWFLCLGSDTYGVNGRRIISKEEDMELEKQLKLINKPPVKSIQTAHGHVVDCIDIEKQLAFDHPLLKDHKIQRRPSFRQGTTKKVESGGHLLSSTPPVIGLEDIDACPLGTVPIRRATKEDLIAAKSLSTNFHTQSATTPGTDYAILQMQKNDVRSYQEIEAEINVYNPRVKEGETFAYISVRGGPDEDINLVSTGWMVSPSRYGDTSSHFFTLWTRDAFKTTGCYNTLCPGFVQIDPKFYPGSALPNASVPSGPDQFAMPASLSQDEKNNWWLTITGTRLGYFPAELFSTLKNPAETVVWGGAAISSLDGVSPPMGSGIFPSFEPNISCDFTNMWYRSASGKHNGPHEPFYDIIIDNPACYRLKYYGYLDVKAKFALQFGGPGGNCGP